MVCLSVSVGEVCVGGDRWGRGVCVVCLSVSVGYRGWVCVCVVVCSHSRLGLKVYKYNVLPIVY